MQELERSHLKQELMEISLVDLFKYLYSHRVFLLITAGAVSFLLVGWVTLMNAPKFKSAAVYQVIAEDNLGSIQLPTFNNLFDEKGVSKKMYVLESLIDSRQYKKALYDEVFGKDEALGRDPEVAEQKKLLRDFFEPLMLRTEYKENVLPSFLSLSRDKENDALILAATTTSGTVSQALASVASRLLVAANFNNNLSQVRAIKSFLEKLTEETKGQLLGVESELTQLQVLEKSFSLQEVSVFYDRSQVESKTKLRELQNRFRSNEVLLAQFKTELRSYLAEMKSGTPSYLYLMQLQKKIDLLKYQIQVNNSDRAPAGLTAGSVDSKAQLDQLIQDFEKELGRNQNDWSMNSWDYWQSLEKNVNELKSKQKVLRGEIEAQENSLKSQGKDFEKISTKNSKADRASTRNRDDSKALRRTASQASGNQSS